ncbi:hypothetical protein K432DRAFT_406410 [Lepidopterella palustris CBS 459.81]|uniref:BZIP domain-containing protein n=1 Tax=Lepidopterella palustris CBS 459.81 TaxID=1314670 RepID=A0A8E2E6Y1_9PEZI|nr:hypothetical protein K432DRAFT_406410 [Lepidopterella palustris CBS 459.81]
MSDAGATGVSDEVPSPGDPDRKRVLNVLAQRRYRQRRRQRIAALEAQAKVASRSRDEQLPSPSSTSSDAVQQYGDAETEKIVHVDPEIRTETPAGSTGFDESVLNAAYNEDFSMLGLDQDALALELNSFPNFDSPPFATPSSQFLQANPTIHFPLSKDNSLDLPLFSTLRAALTIATLLDCTDCVYDPFALRTLQPSPHLPPSLQPTDAQLRIPHHPLLDILPWPSVRSKLVCAFALPASLRPPNARDIETAIMGIVADMDDTAEGFRVAGQNELDGDSWEVGEAFFKNWWWCLDRGVVERSNRLRARRGAPRLRLRSGSI